MLHCERHYQVDVVDAFVNGGESVNGLRIGHDNHVAPTFESCEAALTSPDVVRSDSVITTSLNVQGHEVHAPIRIRMLKDGEPLASSIGKAASCCEYEVAHTRVTLNRA